ncbi:unnamed protein product, partial [marine sediment metagenome]
MGVATNSYGSANGVAAFVPLYTNAGVFDTSTNPTKTIVESWLDQVSSIANGSLSGEGFSIPVTQSDVRLSLVGV